MGVRTTTTTTWRLEILPAGLPSRLDVPHFGTSLSVFRTRCNFSSNAVVQKRGCTFTSLLTVFPFFSSFSSSFSHFTSLRIHRDSSCMMQSTALPSIHQPRISRRDTPPRRQLRKKTRNSNTQSETVGKCGDTIASDTDKTHNPTKDFAIGRATPLLSSCRVRGQLASWCSCHCTSSCTFVYIVYTLQARATTCTANLGDTDLRL